MIGHSICSAPITGGVIGKSALPYLLLGLIQLVLQLGEAEAGHGDEVAHHRDKLVPALHHAALLILQLLQRETGNDITANVRRSFSIQNHCDSFQSESLSKWYPGYE